jgi:DGQHR domain-containing protein
MFSTHVSEGRQGDHRYFTGALRWGLLEHLLAFPEDLGELDDDHRMQRGLATRRLGDLVTYLTEAPNHFFSAITLVMLPRDLDLPAVEDDDEVEEWDFSFVMDEKKTPGQYRRGTLYLSDGIRLFPADGMHRAKAALRALREGHQGIGKEEVPVVLVPYRDYDQVRQMFSDLNLNAKPVSKTTGFDFETRDPIALIAKSAAERVELFKGRVNRHSNSLGATSAQVITLNTLVQGTRSLIEGLATRSYPESVIQGTPQQVKAAREAAVKKYTAKQNRAAAADEVILAWDTIIDAFSNYWATIEENADGAAGKLRQEYLFPHGLGWLALAKAASAMIVEYGEEWPTRFHNAVTNLTWRRDDTPWVGMATIYNEDTDTYRVNNTRPAVDAVADTVINAAR